MDFLEKRKLKVIHYKIEKYIIKLKNIFFENKKFIFKNSDFEFLTTFLFPKSKIYFWCIPVENQYKYFFVEKFKQLKKIYLQNTLMRVTVNFSQHECHLQYFFKQFLRELLPNPVQVNIPYDVSIAILWFIRH